MKFGVQLLEARLQGWEGEYVDYKRLKKLLSHGGVPPGEDEVVEFTQERRPVAADAFRAALEVVRACARLAQRGGF